MASYDVGDLVRVRAQFTRLEDGSPVDPTALVVKYHEVTQVVTTLTYGTDAAVVRAATGDYHVDVPVDLAGTWYVRFIGTGLNQAAAEGTFEVLPSHFS
jgi:hypothetical protein